MPTTVAVLLFGTGFLFSQFLVDLFRDTQNLIFLDCHPIFYDMLCLDGTYLQQQV